MENFPQQTRILIGSFLIFGQSEPLTHSSLTDDLLERNLTKTDEVISSESVIIPQLELNVSFITIELQVLFFLPLGFFSLSFGSFGSVFLATDFKYDIRIHLSYKV